MKFDWQQNGKDGKDLIVVVDKDSRGEVIFSEWDNRWIGLMVLGRNYFRQKFASLQEAKEAVEVNLRKNCRVMRETQS